MEELLRDHLRGHLALSSAEQRIDWGLRPDRTPLPAVSLSVIAAPRPYTFDGQGGLTPYRVRAECWGKTFGAAKLLARGIVAAADGLREAPFAGAFVLSEIDGSDTDQADEPVHRTIIDLRILFRS